MLATLPTDGLAEVLAARDDPMAACHQLKWLAVFKEIPEDAAAPLAMSGPHPRAVGSYGAECIEWARRELGITLRWWQALAITRQLEHDPDGVLVWREIIDTGPRRIGKSVRFRVVALWRTAHADRIGEKQLTMLVSKDLAVGKEIHRGAWRWAEEQGWKVTRLNGGQEVEAPGESRWLLRADTAVYGYDVGYGQVDESWSVDPPSITDGLEPALLERLWAQLHLTSTAHVRATSLMRRRLLAALRDADPDVLLLFFGAHPDADFALEATWRAASPHWTQDRRDLIARKYAAALAGQNEPEFDDPDPIRGWAAQYLNVWPLLLSSSQSAMPTWAACVTSTEAPAPAALGLAMDLDRVWLSLGAASGGEVPHLGSVIRGRVDSDKAKILDEAGRICQKHDIGVVVDAKGPVASLLDDLAKREIPVIRASFDDYVIACSDLYDAVEAKEVEHGDYADLNEAVAAAGWRGNDRRVWSRRSGDVSMLEAVTLAKWGATQPAATFFGGWR